MPRWVMIFVLTCCIVDSFLLGWFACEGKYQREITNLTLEIHKSDGVYNSLTDEEKFRASSVQAGANFVLHALRKVDQEK